MHLHDMMQREMDLKNIFVLFYIQIQNIVDIECMEEK